MIQFSTIDEALCDLRAGKIILVTDDPTRENEGDFICAAEFATTENINFMATYGKGLICMPMSQAYVEKLKIPQMVQQNTDNHETAFTVSIDHVSTSTGISAAERSVTALACVSEDSGPEDFRRPGHMFPLLAKRNGVLERDGHTEATVDLPLGRSERMWPLLRDHARGWDNDAYPGAFRAGETMGNQVYHHPGSESLPQMPRKTG